MSKCTSCSCNNDLIQDDSSEKSESLQALKVLITTATISTAAFNSEYLWAILLRHNEKYSWEFC